jgi:hypothetical protein
MTFWIGFGALAVLAILLGHVADALERLDALLRCSPRAKGAGGHLPAPARVREVVTGDQRPLLKLIDSERNRP